MKSSLRGRIVTAALALLIALPLVALPTGTGPSDAAVFGTLGARWTRTQDGPQKYSGYRVTPDVPIRMSDGTVLRGNLIRPTDRSGAPVREKLPTIVNMTPYTKMVSALASEVTNYPVLAPQLIDLLNGINLQGTVLSGYNELVGALRGGLIQTFSYDPKLIKSGYNMLVVDVRGTGFSQGTWQVFGDRERRDTVEVLDWASKQRWSNGKTGMAGVSYSGINQLQAAADAPGKLGAIFPVVPGADLVRDIIAPGGGLGVGFLSFWLAIVNGTKMIPNIASMLNGTFDWKWLADRVKDPLTYFDLLIDALVTRDVNGFSPQTRSMMTAGTARRDSLYTDVGAITTPSFTIGGWNDLFTNSESRMLRGLSQLPDAKKKLIMDDGYHVTSSSNFGRPGYPPRLDVLARAWYDKWLKGIDNGIDRYPQATLASEPNGGFLQGPSFPLPGHTYQRQYLRGTPSHSVNTPVAGDGSLSASRPAKRATREVKPGLSTLCDRDSAQSTAGVTALFDFCGNDTRLSETAAQTFTGRPATALTRISGTPVVHLRQRLNAPDGYWHATLNVVSPDGRSRVVSMGQLMVSLRAVDPSRSGYAPNGDLTDPVLYLSLDHYAKVRPGQILDVDIPMSATQAALKPGDRLRVDLYSLNFPKSLPLGPGLWSSQLRPQYIEIDPAKPSWVNVPLSRPLG
ncbi:MULTISPECIES: CocE/NonD family hydrolase [Gordonia]|uniref:CocE/NonD family hydrolase n=2 Tax=Gordonia TaxID=2053 RepID=A0ABP5URK8_9ACTN|nr:MULTISPECIES: CocE/NonD family hydrolase [Gordonia]AUH68825.1 peptidase S15 [Gordonia sp. YC-JH1]GAC60077.1 putative hydrolase [Gordonia sihwensis NBRC 108236]